MLVPKSRCFDENGENDMFAFYPQKKKNKGFPPRTAPKRQKWRVSLKQKHGLPEAWCFFPDFVPVSRAALLKLMEEVSNSIWYADVGSMRTGS